MAASRKEEMHEMIERLDRELEEWVESRPKRKPDKDAWTPDNWEEEMKKHPAFCSEPPEDVDNAEKYPAWAALQAIKYDEGDTPEEKALQFKDEGNHYFKMKLYKKATIAYTLGLQQKCEKPEVNAILLTNRAAAHFHLGNNRTSLSDVTKAKELKPDHVKALNRGALCCMELKQFANAVTWCDELLRLTPEDKNIQQLRAKADKLKRSQEKDRRKAQAQEKKQKAQHNRLLQAIKSRGIQLQMPDNADSSDEDDVAESMDRLQLASLEASFPSTGAKVYLDENGCLVWPVMFMYPEYMETDFIQEFHEESRLADHLDAMFGSQRAPWDVEGKYKPDSIEVYFEETSKSKLHKVTLETTLKDILSDSRYRVLAGTPSFILLPKACRFTEEYLRKAADVAVS
ncbi:PREDICTED: tetratricopeptide repeat protein 4-like isoform X1 [Branchiostoma belcheri]|uniref:Tetratricopeptide repeat protein 4-like isoform X1 n=2 Tax=Branchiostoma belcheri TaxID=7741 RepID=A0A6P5A7V7_BRABE|nr:PREDICTED: tetratricopeptide repeat protein 4-like isoform X1 [Branchiostoma belcheri]